MTVRYGAVTSENRTTIEDVIDTLGEPWHRSGGDSTACRLQDCYLSIQVIERCDFCSISASGSAVRLPDEPITLGQPQPQLVQLMALSIGNSQSCSHPRPVPVWISILDRSGSYPGSATSQLSPDVHRCRMQHP